MWLPTAYLITAVSPGHMQRVQKAEERLQGKRRLEACTVCGWHRVMRQKETQCFLMGPLRKWTQNKTGPKTVNRRNTDVRLDHMMISCCAACSQTKSIESFCYFSRHCNKKSRLYTRTFWTFKLKVKFFSDLPVDSLINPTGELGKKNKNKLREPGLTWA